MQNYFTVLSVTWCVCITHESSRVVKYLRQIHLSLLSRFKNEEGSCIVIVNGSWLPVVQICLESSSTSEESIKFGCIGHGWWYSDCDEMLFQSKHAKDITFHLFLYLTWFSYFSNLMWCIFPLKDSGEILVEVILLKFMKETCKTTRRRNYPHPLPLGPLPSPLVTRHT